MRIETRPLEYAFEGARYEAILAADATEFGPRPAVLIAHAWAGRTEFETRWAERLAGVGYVGLALDLYGKGVKGANATENEALMRPLVSDRALLRRRLLKALDVAREQKEIDAANIAIIGFCFGGLCALDLARAGADIAGAASFHGLFTPPENLTPGRIKARVIAFHGFDDPMVPPDAVVALGREMTKAGADWQIHAYGGVMHAFTNPDADDRAFGTVYDQTAAARSWRSLNDFLDECFA